MCDVSDCRQKSFNIVRQTARKVEAGKWMGTQEDFGLLELLGSSVHTATYHGRKCKFAQLLPRDPRFVQQEEGKYLFQINQAFLLEYSGYVLAA